MNSGGILVAALMLAAGGSAARADEVADFYKGRTVTLVQSFEAGGAYALYGRLLTQHLPRHLPGSPTVIVQYMSGAGGVKSANYLYNAALKDGSVLDELFKDIVVAQVLRPDSVKYDSGRFAWIGRMAEFKTVFWITDRSPARTIEDAKRQEVIVGSTGKAAASYTDPTLLNALVGTKFKVITGYKGAANMNQAAEQGETHGVAAAAFLGFVVPGSRRDMWKQGQVRFLTQSGAERHPEMKDVPLWIELSSDPDARRILAFTDSASLVGFHLNAPPGVPAARIAALRKAFVAMTADPAYLAEAKKLNLDTSSADGEALTRVVTEAMAVPAPLLARTRQILF